MSEDERLKALLTDACGVLAARRSRSAVRLIDKALERAPEEVRSDLEAAKELATKRRTVEARLRVQHVLHRLWRS